MSYGFYGFGLAGFGGPGDDNVLDATAGVTVNGAAASLWTHIETMEALVEALGLNTVVFNVVTEDGVQVASAAELVSLVIAAIERVTINATQENYAHLFEDATQEVVPQAVANVVWQMVSVESIVVAPSVDHVKRQIVDAIEFLMVTGVATSMLSAINAVVTSLTVADVARIAVQENVTEAVEIQALVIDRAHHWHALVETALVADEATMTGHVTVLVDEAVAVAADGQSLGHFFENLSEVVAIFGALNIEGDDYLAWVINTETTAAWKYTNFNFNSFAELKHGHATKYYGLRRDGLYLLEGATDAGQMIRASITFPQFDFNSEQQKSLGSTAYIAVKSDGTLVLQVTSTDPKTGNLVAYYYETEGRPSPALRQDRFKVGAGLQSLHYRFKLMNLDGADFDIASLRFMPLFLQRRV